MNSEFNISSIYKTHFRIFGVKCDRCGLVLSPHDLVMRTMSYIYHLGCFQCVICAQPLQVHSLIRDKLMVAHLALEGEERGLWETLQDVL